MFVSHIIFLCHFFQEEEGNFLCTVTWKLEVRLSESEDWVFL